MTRNFDNWLSTMTDSVADWTYYTDFSKVYANVEKIKIPLNLLNSLVGSENIKVEFLELISNYPETLRAIPILIAKRLKDTIIIKDPKKDFFFDFRKQDYTENEYAYFMEQTGLFNMMQNHIVSNLVDYVTGVEVGLDTNGRKNRTGHAMENVVENYFKATGLIRDVDYFKEMYQDDIERMFNVDLSSITNNGKTRKRFDFVLKTNNSPLYLIEVNFYSGGGSKLNETARSYKMITEETRDIKNVEFLWFTDGQGWNSAKNNLRETFEVLKHMYNINDLENGILSELYK